MAKMKEAMEEKEVENREIEEDFEKTPKKREKATNVYEEDDVKRSKSKSSEEIDDLHPSISVATVAKKLSSKEVVGSWEIVKGLVELHTGYGNNMGKSLSSKDGPKSIGMAKHVFEWLRDVYALLDPNKVKTLDGRLVIIGLSRLDQNLRDYLESYGFIDAIKKDPEYTTSFESLLIEKETTAKVKTDRTKLQLDTPSKEDQLGRRGFAEALAGRFSRLWEENSESEGNSFMFHLHGPWYPLGP